MDEYGIAQKSTIHMTNFGHFANFGENKLSNCNFGDANFFSYYYFLSRLYVLCCCGIVGNFCCGIKVLRVANN
jgi:hypothetical protein